VSTLLAAPATEASDRLESIGRLRRAGFRVTPLRCFVEGEPSVAWAATSTFLRPVYAPSASELQARCVREVGRALAARTRARGARAWHREASAKEFSPDILAAHRNSPPSATSGGKCRTFA
jgi:hypothetical protein